MSTLFLVLHLLVFIHLSQLYFLTFKQFSHSSFFPPQKLSLSLAMFFFLTSFPFYSNFLSKILLYVFRCSLFLPPPPNFSLSLLALLLSQIMCFLFQSFTLIFKVFFPHLPAVYDASSAHELCWSNGVSFFSAKSL